MEAKVQGVAPDESRRTLNLWTLAFTILVLAFTFAVSTADGNYANSIYRNIENLDKALVDILGEKDLKYTDINNGIPFKNYTKPRFNPVGMAGLYNFTKIVLGFLVKDIDPDMILDINKSEKTIAIKYDNIPEVLKHYAVFLVLIIILVLMVLFFPLCGFCFCCCRSCCGKCGGRKQMADKKGDLCKKVMHGTLLIALGTGLLFCVVCAFSTSQQFYNGVVEFPPNMKKSVKDTSVFFNNTKQQMTTLLSTNFREFNGSLVNIMEKSSSAVVNELMEFSNATSMTSLATFVNDIPKIQQDMDLLRQATNELRVHANNLNDAMRKVKRDLLNTLNDCKLQECADFKRQVSNLQTNIDFNKLPDISEEIAAFKDFKINDLRAAAHSGIDRLDSVKNTIHNEFQKNINEAQRHLSSAGRSIDKNLKSLLDTLDQFDHELQSNTNPHLNTADFYISKYGQVIYYTGTAVACCLLVVSIFITFGLIWGICGKRPDGYNDNCCNKGAGSKMLMCGVTFMFLSGIIMAVLTIIVCIAAVTTQKAACEPLRHPQGSKLVTYLNDLVDLRQVGVDAKLNQIYDRCYRNQTVYRVFNLETKFKMKEIIEKFDINKTLDGLNFDKSVPDNFYILDRSAREVLRKLAHSSAEFNFDKFESELENNNFTTVSLEEVKRQLKAVIEKAPESLKPDLNLSYFHLDSYDERILQPMRNTSEVAKRVAINLGNAINMGKNSLPEAIRDLIDEISKAEGMIKNEGKAHLVQTAKKFIASVKNLVDGYINRVTSSIENDIGKCGNLYRVLDFTLVSTCDKIILPLNGFWLNLFCALVLYIPTIIISVKLANVYQKRKSNGHYVEAEYLYDAYSDRDNIPLNSRNKRNKKNNKKKSKRYEDRPQNVGGEIVSREYASGSHTDARYADMAPKHWEDFPAGGPPQYQRAPTEYERPPPYYYPGSGGEN